MESGMDEIDDYQAVLLSKLLQTVYIAILENSQ